jgi:hypothetical protein
VNNSFYQNAFNLDSLTISGGEVTINGSAYVLNGDPMGAALATKSLSVTGGKLTLGSANVTPALKANAVSITGGYVYAFNTQFGNTIEITHSPYYSGSLTVQNATLHVGATGGTSTAIKFSNVTSASTPLPVVLNNAALVVRDLDTTDGTYPVNFSATNSTILCGELTLRTADTVSLTNGTVLLTTNTVEAALLDTVDATSVAKTGAVVSFNTSPVTNLTGTSTVKLSASASLTIPAGAVVRVPDRVVLDLNNRPVTNNGVILTEGTGNVTNTSGLTGNAVGLVKVNISALEGLTYPVAGAARDISVTATAQYTASVSWTGDFKTEVNDRQITYKYIAGNTYTATITLTPKQGYTFTGVTENFFTVAGATTVTNPANSGVVTATFASVKTTVNNRVVSGLTAPVAGATAVLTCPPLSKFLQPQYTGAVTWSPSVADNGGKFAANTAYTATVVFTPTSGYTFQGLAANTLTVAGATSVSHPAGVYGSNLTATVVFPATGDVAISGGEISEEDFDVPATGGTPVTAFEAEEFTATVAWFASTGGGASVPVTFAPGDTFDGGTTYTAVITLTPKTGFSLTDGATYAVAGQNVTLVVGAGGTGTLTITFPATEDTQDTLITVSDLPDIGLETTVTAGALPVTEYTHPQGLFSAQIEWFADGDPMDDGEPFVGGVQYTAVVTFLFAQGYDFDEGAFGDSGLCDYDSVSHILTVTYPLTKYGDTAWFDADPTAAAFTITTAAQLQGFSWLVQTGNDFTGKTVTLGANISLAGIANFRPIGDPLVNNGFNGIFDGAGHTISDLTIAAEVLDKVGSAEFAAGLFPIAGLQSVIKDLVLEDAVVTVRVISQSEMDWMAQPINGVGIAVGRTQGEVNGVRIYNSSLRLTKERYDTYTYGIRNIGGVAGYVGGIVTGCTTHNVSVSAVRNNNTYGGIENVGGIVGYGRAKFCANTEDSTADAHGVTPGVFTFVEGNDGGPTYYVGGIVGFGSAAQCFNAVAVNAGENKNAYVGGIVGYGYDDTTYACINTGAVSGVIDVGGIAGSTDTSINSCVNTGDVTGNSAYVAGIVAYACSTVENCAALGANITFSSDFGNRIAGENDLALTNNYGFAGTIVIESESGTGGTVSPSEHNGANVNRDLTAPSVNAATFWSDTLNFPSSMFVLPADGYALPTLRNLPEGVSQETLTITENGPLAHLYLAPPVPPEVVGVAITTAPASIAAGGTTVTFAATVTVIGDEPPATTVTWSVTGGTSAGTAISTGGVLVVGEDETARTLTVTATSTADPTKSASASIAVTASPAHIAAVTAAADALTSTLLLGATGGTDLDHVTGTLTLPTAGSGTGEGVTISWTSDSSTVNAATGSVTRPAYGSANETITLTATLTKGLETQTKTIIVTVLANDAPPPPEHTHTADTSQWLSNATVHWHACIENDGAKLDEAAHTANGWIVDSAPTETATGSRHKECDVCGYVLETETLAVLPHTHVALADWSSDATTHWHACTSNDGYKFDEAAHTAGDEWITDTPATTTSAGSKHKECTVCGRILESATIPIVPPGHTHTFDTVWHSDATNHWHECPDDGERASVAPHTESEWFVDAAATETAAGSRHKECTICARVLVTETLLPLTHTHVFDTVWHYDATNHWHECTAGDEARDGVAEHTFGEWVTDTPPTPTATGARHKDCTVCGYSAVEAIPATGTGGGEDEDDDDEDEPTNPPSEDEPTNAERVADTKAALTWDVISDEELSAVTGDLVLPASDSDTGATIVWASSVPEIVDVSTAGSGVVNRPAFGEDDVQVTLTATITVGDESDTKTFTVTVLAEDEDDDDTGTGDPEPEPEPEPDTGAFAPRVVVSEATYAAGASALERVFAEIRGVSLPAAGTEIVAGRSVTLTVEDAGEDVSYSWRKNGVAVGTDAPAYTEADIQPGDTFSVLVTKHAAGGDTTVEVVLPALTILPDPNVLNAGITPAVVTNGDGSVTLGVSPAGTTGRVYYQWFKRNAATGAWDAVPDAIARTLTLTSPDAAGDYRVQFTDRTRIIVTSASVNVAAVGSAGL